jgi:cell wall-associated NlpC family hydrolase
MFENIPREAVVREARTWLGTPYNLGACVKGVGVDCVQFVAEVYKAVGLVPCEEEVGIFMHDWFAHTHEELYLLRVLKYTKRIVETQAYRSVKALPGDLILTKAAQSKVYNHAGIVLSWPTIIHAISPAVVEVNATTHPMWAFKKIVVLDPWQTHDRKSS